MREELKGKNTNKKSAVYAINLETRMGQKIRDLRQQYRMTQEGLAEELGVHPSYVGQLERGERQASLQTLQKLAHAFSLPPDELIREEEEQDKEGLKKRCLALLDKCSSSQIYAICELLTAFIYKRG